MILQFTYWEGYPIETDMYYDINASLVSNDWVEEDTVWTERPEYLGTSTLTSLDNPNLESEIYLDLTHLIEGITNPLISIHLCPDDLFRIRFPSPFYSSESNGITPCLILEYSTILPPIKLKDISKKCDTLKNSTESSFPVELLCTNCKSLIILTEYMKSEENTICEKCGHEVKIPK